MAARGIDDQDSTVIFELAPENLSVEDSISWYPKPKI